MSCLVPQGVEQAGRSCGGQGGEGNRKPNGPCRKIDAASSEDEAGKKEERKKEQNAKPRISRRRPTDRPTDSRMDGKACRFRTQSSGWLLEHGRFRGLGPMIQKQNHRHYIYQRHHWDTQVPILGNSRLLNSSFSSRSQNQPNTSQTCCGASRKSLGSQLI